MEKNTQSYRKILLTAFRGSSAEKLIKGINGYKTLILPNDKIMDTQKLINVISKEKFEYIISFGQKPVIKDKVHIETVAKDKEFSITTNFDCEELRQHFIKNGLITKISNNCGTSYCNQIYLNGLKFILQNGMDTKMVFVHIPFNKNITEFDDFCKKIYDSIRCIV